MKKFERVKVQVFSCNNICLMDKAVKIICKYSIKVQLLKYFFTPASKCVCNILFTRVSKRCEVQCNVKRMSRQEEEREASTGMKSHCMQQLK